MARQRDLGSLAASIGLAYVILKADEHIQKRKAKKAEEHCKNCKLNVPKENISTEEV